jgi:hypothetical protein
MNMQNDTITLTLTAFTSDFYSGISGLSVGQEIDKLVMANPERLIKISMYGIDNVSPSFINGAFLYVIDLYGIEYFRKYIKIVQISQRLLPEIKNAIDNHIVHKQTFYQNLITNTIFVGIDGGRMTMQMRRQLFDTVSSSSNFLWNQDQDNQLTDQTKADIARADAFIGIWTVKRREKQIIDQANYAISLGKSCLIFCSKKIYIKVSETLRNRIELFRFDEDDSFIAFRNLNETILEKQVRMPVTTQKGVQMHTVLEVAGWAALGVAGAWLLSEIIKKK